MRSEISILIFCLSFTLSSCAHLKGGDDPIGPYPAVGSAEEKIEFDELLSFQKTRTSEQCSAAAFEASHTSLGAFFGGNTHLLSDDEVTKVEKELTWIKIKAGVQILMKKISYSRPRPYTNHPEIKPCIELEFSKAYPSGHTAMSRLYARILSVVYPARSAQFIKRSDEIALHRVIGGVHLPSDIVAGKKLGDALADTYLSDIDFKKSIEQIGEIN